MADDIVVRVGIDATPFIQGANGINRGIDGMRANLGRMVSSVSNGISQAANIMTRLDVTAISLAQSQARVKAAQDGVNEAVAKFGPASKQAIDAQKELTNAQQNAEKTQLRARLTYILMAGDLAVLATKAPQTARQVLAVGTAARSAAAGMTAFQIATVGLTGALAAAAAVLGGIALFKEWQDETQRGASAADELAMAEERLAKTQERVNRLGFLGSYAQHAFAKALPGVESAMHDVTQAHERLADAQAAYNAEQTAQKAMELAQAQAEAAATALAWEQANGDLVSSLNSSLAQMGTNLNVLSIAAQEPILLKAGLDPSFVATMMAAKRAEEELTIKALHSSKALRDQTEITAKKDETTEEFIVRLKDLGFTEEEVAARVDETGRALRSQADATMAASQATTQATAAKSSTFQRAPDLASLIDANIGKIVGAAWGMGENSFRVNYNKGRYNGEDILNVLTGQDTEATFASQELLGTAAMRGTVKQTIEALVLSLPSSMWDGLLKQMQTTGKVPGFAHGFEGIVRGPSLFLAGEHGPERVSVSPMSRGARGGSGGIVVNGGIHVHANDARGGRDAADEIMRRLSRLGVQGQIA